MDDVLFERYKRSPSIPYPNTYSSFKGRKEIDGKIPRFTVQDLTEDMIEEVAEIMSKHFIYEEPAHKHSNFSEDPVSVEEEKELLKYILTQQLGLVCLVEDANKDGKPKIAAYNATYIKGKEKGDEILPQGEKLNYLRVALKWLEDNFMNPFEELQITECINSMGLYVLKEYRGQGIGDELLKARITLCKNIGMKYTVTPFTSQISQKIATRCGYKTLFEIPYEELFKREPEVFKYPSIMEDSKDFKLMYLKTD